MRTLGNGWLGSRYIHINGVRFEVIGVLRTLRGGPGRVFIPYTCMRELFWNASWLLDAVPKRGLRRAAAKEIDALLFRRIGDPGSTYVALPGVSYEELKVYLFFGIVGVLVLFSAGAAVSNKAYIDALERVPQFAVRRAFGATRQRIYAAVLMESAIICGFGGLYGGIIGWMIFASFSAPRWMAANIVTPGVWASYTIPALPLGAMLLFFVSLGVLGSLQGAAIAANANPAEVLGRKEVV
jgi:putative ABC transport system permease protein